VSDQVSHPYKTTGKVIVLTPRVNRHGRPFVDLLSYNVFLMPRLGMEVAISLLPYTSCHGVHREFAFTFIVSLAVLL
jgi:hypothetical protein